jgi:DNA-binding MarR family transcriptional regulator
VLIELTAEGAQKWVVTAEAQAAYENLIGAALNKREKEQLNSLLRRLMLEFERSESSDSKKP